jgi:hypothetical protein
MGVVTLDVTSYNVADFVSKYKKFPRMKRKGVHRFESGPEVHLWPDRSVWSAADRGSRDEPLQP